MLDPSLVTGLKGLIADSIEVLEPDQIQIKFGNYTLKESKNGDYMGRITFLWREKQSGSAGAQGGSAEE